jgi:hypothetical protein
MKLATTNDQNLQGAAELAGAEAMANEAIRVAESLMWAIYGSDEAAHTYANAGAGVLHTERLRLAS